MLRSAFLAAAISLVALSPAQASDEKITVGEYLEIWNKIDAAAIRAEIEAGKELNIDNYPNAKRASEEVGAIAKDYREQFEADRKAGRTPHSCLPDGEAEVNTDVLIPHLQSYSDSDKATVTMVQAFADLMKKTYPCG